MSKFLDAFKRGRGSNMYIRAYQKDVAPTLVKDGYDHILIISRPPDFFADDRTVNVKLTNWVNFVLDHMRRSGFVILNLQNINSSNINYNYGGYSNNISIMTYITYQYAPQQYRR